MQRFGLAALCALGAACWASPSSAVTFAFTGAIQSWTVPTTGLYQIDLWGARGGTWNRKGGGLGAQVGGRIELSAGTVYSIVVGGMGNSFLEDTGAGGGGASWMFVQAAASPLAVAGGGGGSGYFDFSGSGGPGLIDPGDGSGGLSGGNAGGGAGWLSAGENGTAVIVANGGVFPYGTGGQSGPTFQGGMTIGNLLPPYDLGTSRTGGFGGGGGGGYSSGGGGGGYTGGIGGRATGGTSYLDAGFTNTRGFSGVRSGDGQITIDSVGIPEPATWALMISGFGLAGVALRRRRTLIAA